MDNNNPAAGESGKKSSTRFFPHSARVLMGIALLAFGIMGILMFLNILKLPDNQPEELKIVNGALMKAGYMKVVSGTMTLVGILLLINRFVPLALALIAPILAGILTYHISIQPSGIVPGAVLSFLELYLAWSYRDAFCPMLRAKVAPGAK